MHSTPMHNKCMSNIHCIRGGGVDRAVQKNSRIIWKSLWNPELHKRQVKFLSNENRPLTLSSAQGAGYLWSWRRGGYVTPAQGEGVTIGG